MPQKPDPLAAFGTPVTQGADPLLAFGTLVQAPQKKSDAPDPRTAQQVMLDQMDAVSRGYLQPIKDLPDTALSLAELPFMSPGERAQKVMAAVKSYAQPAVASVKGAISGKKIVLPGMGGAIQFPDYEEGNPGSPVWTQAAEGAGANMTNTMAAVAAAKALRAAKPKTSLNSNFEVETKPGALQKLSESAMSPAAREAVIKALKAAGLITGGGIGAEIYRRLFPDH